MTLFLNLGGWLAHSCVGVTSAASVIAEGNTALFLSAPLLIQPVHFSREVMRVCRVSQMPDVFACAHPPPSPPSPSRSLPLPLVPAWTQALNQSIRAPGTGAQQCLCAAQRSAALSGAVHLWPPGGEPGEEREPRCPLRAGFYWKVFLAQLCLLRSTCNMFRPRTVFSYTLITSCSKCRR